MRVNKNISTKERRRYALDRLMGVDFSSSPLLCAPNRSPEAVNWIGDHGINRKRNGWEQVMDRFIGKDSGIQEINMILPIDETTLLVYAGMSYYLCELSNGKWSRSQDQIAGGNSVEQRRTQGWRNGNFIYIIGDGAYRCYDVEGETFINISPYIPTTTINIGHDGKENDVCYVLEHPNLLTPKRKNTLEGVNLEGTANKSKWLLDGKIASNTEVNISASIYFVDGSTEKGYYIEEWEITNKDKDEKIGETLYKKIGETYTELGSIELDAGDGRSGIIFTVDTTPPVEGQANITVEYTAVVADKKGWINGCTFGTLFGVGGAQDRLFLSGNSAFPNVVFFSEANDFTYFPDQYTATFGTDQKPIKGFLRLSDSTLAVLKEDGVYYQRGEYRTEYDDAGNIKKITPVFSITAGSINESAVNPYACVNFDGDNVFLSKHGVFGIEPTSNVLTDTRAARERSYAISARMGEFNASNAVAVTHGQKLYISDGNVCYVADSAYKYVPEGRESYNYEWWYWDHLPVRVWAEVNGELWFGTEDGRICRFSEGYRDSSYDLTQKDDIKFEYLSADEDGYIYYNYKDLKDVITKGRRVRFDTKGWIDDEENSLTGIDLYVHSTKEADGKNGEKLYYMRLTRYKDAGETEYLTYGMESADEVTDTILRIYDDTPVVAEWVSPPLDLGNDSIAKNLYSLTVTAETGKNSVLSFGYETRKRFEEMNAAGLGVFSFEDMSLEAFSFENGFQTSYTVRARDRNFNFIRFILRSDGERACAVHRISAIYKFNKYGKGVV